MPDKTLPSIRKVAVIGAGTMGGGIASHLANAGIDVLLYDVADEHGNDRSAHARSAIERMLQSAPPPLMHPDNATRITPCNLSDDLPLLANVDWIAEAIVERLEVKRDLYRRLDAVRKPGSFVSSNTSTLPLSLLTAEQSAAFRRDFCITHFFNPVRYMRLLELVRGPETRDEVINALAEFCDQRLGKGIVHCRDTPGFLANRVGVYALQVGLREAHRHGLRIEEADAIMGRPMGIPKTGVFGLYDLIGLDLMLDVVASLKMPLPASDPFYEVADGIKLVSTLVASGHNGNKSGAGFYRTRFDDGVRLREVIDLTSGEYREAERVTPAAARAAEQGGLRALVTYPDAGGRFAWDVLARTLSYAASLIPDVTDRPDSVDEAMKLGYSWSQGPFEMIDELGASWFAQRLREHELPVPAIVDTCGEQRFYSVRGDGEGASRIAMHGDATYHPIARAPGVIRLCDLKARGPRILGNDAASLWHVGQDVACIEFHSKANALSPRSMAVIEESVALARGRFRALLVHNEAPHFSVGFNLEFALDASRRSAWSELDSALDAFQRACCALRDVPIPVVGAPSGLGLGGGYEVLVHCDRLQAHANINFGLVETLVGVVPSGGGCKEMLARWCQGAQTVEDAIPGAVETFKLIGMAKTASSPQLARSLRLMRDQDAVSMNRDRLLAQGRALALSLAEHYVAPPPPRFIALGDAGRVAMNAVLDPLVQKGVALAHDQVVSRALARVLCGGDAKSGTWVTEQHLLDLEREAFLTLAALPDTRARIEHMLRTGEALRN